ncbi:hypothetical protein ND861_01245 [Leptospira sp. 2 VSF19]|uniref:HEAT repeat domain-containing protein n=1 Tax=Leptospira soteropolitanensis TaxID=2950025 RepID=A0AAW5VEJ7_9LEPT|nr:hypothetical protein [Leptospira soteropolitanensis]MCW7491270.1 hypothetical protein [Leptospira soteropolitanensis]MCW7498855.1 hypothetical protein [Leptospira soteropolitanensis]MCW7521553.1 hypothetical protein [Leptospira soteropolitanensis]MCW7524958.1 hypothetical protein [Leptospira soteropolitanensis]MCW7528826.1 hypothetical protein [Leptospira soteropolitanensis]
MTKRIEHLLKNSHLPGPRGNLGLLYLFSKNASENEVNECLSFYNEDLSNSPEEFVVMCGIVGYCILNNNNIKKTLTNIRKYASHSSWRIRESVAIGIQEITENHKVEILTNLKKWMSGNDLEKRAIVAALCEPKLLKEKSFVNELLEILNQITLDFEKIEGKLSGNQISLRKTLGYGWSVAIASLPKEGKIAFEKIAKYKNKHIKWIVKENLKKNRLLVMDKQWVERLLTTSKS